MSRIVHIGKYLSDEFSTYSNMKQWSTLFSLFLDTLLKIQNMFTYNNSQTT